MPRLIGVLFITGVIAAGCTGSPDRELDKAPVGADVQVTRQDGALVEGKLAAKDATTVRVERGATTRTVPRSEIVEVAVKDEKAATAPAIPARATFREVTIPESTKIAVKLNSSVSSETSRVEDTIDAELAESIVIEGDTVLPAGSTVKGVVTSAVPTGKVKGRASLGLHFNSIAADGVSYPIDARFARMAPSEKADDVKKIAIPAVGGAIVGAIIGGKKGAAIGATAGGGAGTAAVLMDAGDPVVLGDGAVLSLTIGQPVEVRVKLQK